MEDQDHLIIGGGEVGQALYQVMRGILPTMVRDTGDISATADVIHIAFPWSETFIEHVRWYQQKHQAKLVIVHSTVVPGTCDSQGWVHSPIRGRHPHLAEGIRAFIKHFGGPRAEEAARFFRPLGINTNTHPKAIDTEAGKLWELIQFGVNVIMEKDIHDWCEKHGADFDTVYIQFARTYNAGYVSLGDYDFHRPILKHMPGPIGGHCVVPCAPLVDHYWSEVIENYNAP